MKFSQSQLQKLVAGKPITEDWPWGTADRRLVEKHIKSLIATIRRDLRVKDKTDFNHYGSGYASFVDCWLYRENNDFRFGEEQNSYIGLVVLFSRLTNVFSLAEGTKCWRRESSGSYMPSFEIIDQIEHPSVRDLEEPVTSILGRHGLERLKRVDIGSSLSDRISVPTILEGDFVREYDAIFYWED